MSYWNPISTYQIVLGTRASPALVSFWTLCWLALFFLLTFTRLGFGSQFWWFYATASLIALVFGLVLIVCSRSHSNRLSFEKGLELAKRLDKIEAKFLKGTDMGVRAGPEGAWIEVGFEKHLNTFYWKFIERKLNGEQAKLEPMKDELNLEKTTREVVKDIKGLISQNIASNVPWADQTVSLGQEKSQGSIFDLMGSLAEGPAAGSQAVRYEEPAPQPFAVQFRDRLSADPSGASANGPVLQMTPQTRDAGGMRGSRFSASPARDSFGQASTCA